MSIYEVINPSDAVTYETKNPTALLVGFTVICPHGGIALRDVETKEMLRPIMLGWDDDDVSAWMKAALPKDFAVYLDDNAEVVADALESVVYGNAVERELYDLACEGKPRAEIRAFREKWNDKNRSSITDYSTPSLVYADHLRTRVASAEPVCGPAARNPTATARKRRRHPNTRGARR